MEEALGKALREVRHARGISQEELSRAASLFAESFSGKVVAITDVDTIKVLHNGLAERVRLWGMDCPESHQAFGTKATRFTGDLAFGRVVAPAFAPPGVILSSLPDADCHIHEDDLERYVLDQLSAFTLTLSKSAKPHFSADATATGSASDESLPDISRGLWICRLLRRL